MEGRENVLSATVWYLDIRVWLCSAMHTPWIVEHLKTYYVSASLDCTMLIFNILQLDNLWKERGNRVSILRQRGTLRRVTSGKGKYQRGCSFHVVADYEPHISHRVCVLVEAWEGRVLNQKLATGQDGSQINHYWLMKNMLCNLMEDMLTNWADARDTVQSVKTRISEIDAQLTAMESSFAWKGNVGISGHGGLNGGSRDRGGGGSGSTMGGMVLHSHGDSGNATRCTIAPPPALSFPIPSTVEPLFKCLKEMSAQQPAQMPPEVATNSPNQSQEERWACPITK